MGTDKFRNTYRIPSARHPNWDYRRQGMYFVTLCTQNRLHYFGHVENGEMILSYIGQIAHNHWFDIPNHFPFIGLINFMVMPNHVHGLLQICDIPNDLTVETLHATSLPNVGIPQKNEFMAQISPKRGSLPSIIRSYKSSVTRYANQNKIEFGWQTRYHDHIVRDDDEYHRIYKYISDNPLNWHNDKFYSGSN